MLRLPSTALVIIATMMVITKKKCTSSMEVRLPSIALVIIATMVITTQTLSLLFKNSSHDDVAIMHTFCLQEAVDTAHNLPEVHDPRAHHKVAR
jgi:uncharacterized protein YoxC